MLSSARKVCVAARFAGQCGNCPPAGMAGGWRFCVTARSWPKCRAGVHARRWGLAVSLGRCGTMQASSPTKHRARLCRVCGISPPQAGNAPLRLRLAAHPPSGLRCPHRTARAEARLCSATVKPAPSRFLRRRRRSTPQPLAGEAVKPPLERLPCKGSWRRQPTEGCSAWLCQYPSGSPQAFPALRHYRPPRCGAYAKSQRHPFAPPAGVNARPTI